jgi:hypothetical protein
MISRPLALHWQGLPGYCSRCALLIKCYMFGIYISERFVGHLCNLNHVQEDDRCILLSKSKKIYTTVSRKNWDDALRNMTLIYCGKGHAEMWG